MVDTFSLGIDSIYFQNLSSFSATFYLLLAKFNLSWNFSVSSSLNNKDKRPTHFSYPVDSNFIKYFS